MKYEDMTEEQRKFFAELGFKQYVKFYPVALKLKEYMNEKGYFKNK
ncbi:hypothetical protein KM868_11845 [Micrococcus luteus]|nr:hypothetical protein [Micrococcus luteus]MBU8764184.1 hypothetical protein [Micrococcus luteus]